MTTRTFAIVCLLTSPFFLSMVSSTIQDDTFLEHSNQYYEERFTYADDFSARNVFDQCEIPNGRSYASSTSKICLYRGQYFPEMVYKWYTGHGCYMFTQPASLNPLEPRANVSGCVHEQRMIVPCFVIPRIGGKLCYPIDSDIPEVVKEIERMMINNYAAQKWIRCTNEAMNCCRNVMTEENIKPQIGRCPAIWDAWNCWEPTAANTTAKKACPEFAYSNQGPTCHHYSTKTCFDNSTWNQVSDYSSCSVKMRFIQRIDFHVTVLLITISISTPAVIVMFAYQRLRVHRLALHRNLLISIILRCIIVVIIKWVILKQELTATTNDTIMQRNDYPCKILAVLEKIIASSVFTCMLVDGVFMHRRIVAIFKKDLHIATVYAIAGVVTIVPVIIWTILVAIYNDLNCWLVYIFPGLQWTLDTPRILMLIINTFLMIDILRIIMTKMNRKENPNQLSTAKATLFLMPLFGAQFLLTAWRPNFTSCDWEQAYYYFTYILEGLQGILVAVLYCYANKEVHRLIYQTYKTTEEVVSTHFKKNSATRRATRMETTFRRGTLSTILSSSQIVENSRKNSNPVLLRFSNNSNYYEGRENNVSPSVPAEPFASPLNFVELDEDKKLSLDIFKTPFYACSKDGLIGIDFEDDNNGLYENRSFQVRTISDDLQRNQSDGDLKTNT